MPNPIYTLHERYVGGNTGMTVVCAHPTALRRITTPTTLTTEAISAVEALEPPSPLASVPLPLQTHPGTRSQNVHVTR